MQSGNHHAGVASASAIARENLASFREREVTILFADLRGFTRLAEDKLPYDVVFILNRYFAAMGGAVEAAGGRVDKFIGDGVMALFGIEEDAATGARQALAAVTAARGLQGLDGPTMKRLETEETMLVQRLDDLAR